MNRPLTAWERLVYIFTLVVLLALLWLGLVLPIKEAFAKIGAETFAAQATQSRLIQAIARLEAAPKAGGLPEGALWAGASSNLVQADFQQRLGALAAQNQMAINSITPLSIGDIEGFPTVALRAEGQGGYGNFLAFIDSTMQSTPKIAISAFSIRQLPGQANVPEVHISFQVTFWAATSTGEEG